MHIVEHNSLESLRPLRDAWHSLLPHSPYASFFHTFDWLAAHWPHVSEQRKLRVLVAYDGPAPVGVLPLNVQTETTRLGNLRTLTFPLDGWGSFYGPLGRDPTAVLAAGLQHLRVTRRDHHLLDLRGLAPSITAASLPEASRPAFWNEVAVIDLDQPWDAYWESRKHEPNRRRNIERCERRLLEQGAVRYVRYRPQGAAHADCDPRWDLYDQCERLAGRSWQSGLVDGNTLSHPHVREFLRDAHVAAANFGALDINLLYLNDRPVAFVYGYHYRGYLDLMRIGFDPDLAKFAPGNALWTRLIQDSLSRGDRLLDLGPTCLDYKKFWLTRLIPSQRVFQYPLTARGQALRMLRWLRERLAHPAEAMSNEDSKQAVLRVGKQTAELVASKPDA